MEVRGRARHLIGHWPRMNPDRHRIKEGSEKPFKGLVLRRDIGKWAINKELNDNGHKKCGIIRIPIPTLLFKQKEVYGYGIIGCNRREKEHQGIQA